MLYCRMDEMTDLVLMKVLEIDSECLMYLAVVKIVCAAFLIWGRIFMRRVN